MNLPVRRNLLDATPGLLRGCICMSFEIAAVPMAKPSTFLNAVESIYTKPGPPWCFAISGCASTLISDGKAPAATRLWKILPGHMGAEGSGKRKPYVQKIGSKIAAKPVLEGIFPRK
jgi:hypothetical protein